MKTVCVTGAAGFVGRNLVKKLLENNFYVVGIDNLSSGKDENIEEFFKNKNFVFSQNDLRDEDSIFNIFRIYNPEIVFHLAAMTEIQYSINNPIETNNNNVGGILNVLEASRRTNVKRFVFASSSGIYGDVNVDQIPEYEEKKPLSPYAVQKLIGEIYCGLYYRLYGLETISLRLFNIYGPYQKATSAYATLIPKTIRRCLDYESPEIYGTGYQTRDFVFVNDVVNAFLKAGNTENKECFGESFNIGTGSSTTVNNVVDEIMIQTDTRELDIVKLPSIIEPFCVRADVDKARKLLEWEALMDLSSGLKRTIEYFEEI